MDKPTRILFNVENFPFWRFCFCIFKPKPDATFSGIFEIEPSCHLRQTVIATFSIVQFISIFKRIIFRPLLITLLFCKHFTLAIYRFSSLKISHRKMQLRSITKVRTPPPPDSHFDNIFTFWRFLLQNVSFTHTATTRDDNIWHNIFAVPNWPWWIFQNNFVRCSPTQISIIPKPIMHKWSLTKTQKQEICQNVFKTFQK